MLMKFIMLCGTVMDIDRDEMLLTSWIAIDLSFYIVTDLLRHLTILRDAYFSIPHRLLWPHIWSFWRIGWDYCHEGDENSMMSPESMCVRFPHRRRHKKFTKKPQEAWKPCRIDIRSLEQGRAEQSRAEQGRAGWTMPWLWGFWYWIQHSWWITVGFWRG